MENKNLDRRRFLSITALGAVATQFAGFNILQAKSLQNNKIASQNSVTGLRTFAIKQVRTPLLDIGYADEGPVNGRVVILLHGWPYDIHSFADTAALLTAKGYRVLIPHLRGHGTTMFLSEVTARNGQQAAIAKDIIDFMDALRIKNAIIGGFDWGARTANIIAALWPERCQALISVSGYLIGSQEGNKKPLPPKAELSWWYQYYFSTERGREGYKANTHDFAKLIWQTASPEWKFDDATFARSAASLDNPDHVDIVIHNYRWRLGLAEGESRYDAYETKLATFPDITVPAITLEGDANGAPHPKPEDYAKRFKNKYEHRTLTGGIGHNLPQEAPQDFAGAIIAAAAMVRQ
ncbi:alpha/beta hydrolase [Mucilaginibacter gynuensis]|uniref:Alpha/beta hydrolase n=1 Tax=Mucilaginibacter gynuensis TaxID=1302236 RepID=A0ABP8GGG1_9SPHI